MKTKRLAPVVSSIEFFLNPKISGDPELMRLIADHLVKGDLVVIRDALQEPFAEKIFSCLDRLSDWKVYERHEKHFHYRHHGIYDQELFPPDLRLCQTIFGSDSTKRFMQGLSHRDCGGEARLSASLYLPGDHLLPHNDLTSQGNSVRQVTFVWNLTKSWRDDWGGDFFWCPKNRIVLPSFNTLLLFNVSDKSLHFVTPVSPYAQSKRLAVSGWWTGSANPEENLEAPPDPPTAKEKRLVEII